MSLIQAFALPAARFTLTAWTWLYTLAAPEEERKSHRAVVCSDLHEQMESSREEGLGPVAMAIRIFLRMLCGLPGDVMWAAPYLPATLARNLMGASEAISRPDTLKLLIPWLAVFSVMNGLWVMSDDSWLQGLALNGVMLVGMRFMWNHDLSWVRRILNFGYDSAAPLMVGVLVWAIVQHRLYQIPTFSLLMLAGLSVVLATVVADQSVRGRVFKGQWWPVFVCWVLIATTSLVTASFITGGLTILLAVWAYAALMALALVMLFAMIFIAALGWYGGLRAGAVGMRLMAVGIGRLF